MGLDSTPMPPTHSPVLARFDDVWVAYATQTDPRESLRGVSLQIRQGQWTAIVGHNGSGKSTISKVLTGLCGISKGSLILSNPDLRVRIVFQNPESQAIGETVWEDVCFQPGSVGTEHTMDVEPNAMRALNRVQLSSIRHQRIETLSGGQKQRLAIASATVEPVDLLIFDEATTMLDAENRRQVWQTAQELRRAGTSILWITQRMDEVHLADQVLVLEGGTVTFDGSPRAFFYPGRPDDRSVCESKGFEPPYTVRVGRALTQSNLSLKFLPLTPSELQRSLGPVCL